VTAGDDPWSVLGIDSSATYDEARHAYLLRAQLLHPDRHEGAPADVLAEAHRAMRALNDAWETVRGRIGEAGPSGPALTDPGPADPGPTAAVDDAVPSTPDECLVWVVRHLVDAGLAHGDPLQPEEISRLLSPLATAPGGRRFDRWLEHRRRTLRQAIDDGGAGAADWGRAWRVLADSGVSVVMMTLLDRRLSGRGGVSR